MRRIRNFFKKAINNILSPLGLRICTTDTYNFINKFIDLKYIELIKEVHEFFNEKILIGLPPFDYLRAELIAKLNGTEVIEAMYIIAFLNRSLDLKGDVCEFGAGSGATSALLANEIRNTEKKLWLFDSFQGLPKPSKDDTLIHDVFGLGSIEKYEGTFSASIESVKSRLQDTGFPVPRTRIISGFIERTLNLKNLPDKVCFAYVDVDLYNPTLMALEFIGEHLSLGGFIVVDDYNFFSSGVKKAVDEFTEKHAEAYDKILIDNFAGPFIILRKRE